MAVPSSGGKTGGRERYSLPPVFPRGKGGEEGTGIDRFPNLPVPFPFSAQITVRDLLLTRFATCWRALFYTLGPVKVVTDDNGEKTAT